MKTRSLLVAAMLLAALAPGRAASAASPPAGAAEIVLEGGTSGDVAFPHRRHQEKLVDCNICHAAYPQKPRAIEELKEQGALKKKEIMNNQCTKCHKEKQGAGEKTGPTTCTTCHVKR